MIWKSAILLSLLSSLHCAAASPKKHQKDATTTLDPSPSSSDVSNSSTTAPPLRSFNNSMPHTPFTETPTTTGALTASSIGTGISHGGVAAGATTYPADGKLHHSEPAPHVPAGGLGTNGSTPVYNTKSDFDYQSLVCIPLNWRTSAVNQKLTYHQALALYQEWIELDLFQDGLRRFNDSTFQAAGMTAADRELIAFMAEQETGHATMLSNILGARAPQKCSYIYPYTNVKEFVDFCQKLTRWGESSVYGFLPHLDSREAANLLTQAITTEARQQMIFRQFEGLFPMVEWFEAAIPQSWGWTLLAPFISSCPENQTRLVWQNFPALMVVNQPDPWVLGISSNFSSANNVTSGYNATGIPKSPKGTERFNSSTSANECGASVSKVRPLPLTAPGRTVLLQWDLPGKKIGPNNSYITTTETKPGSAKYVLWVSQLNATYTPLHVVNGTNSTSSINGNNGTNSTVDGIRGYTTQPNLETYQGNPAFNGTIFIAITDSNQYVSPFNLSLINPHVVAGPALYQAG
ncbi:Pc21g07780 [Penicillium rubens Wisconsin 54-1255]|uniref:Pc21g07780 protein n=1 Tax=Penicillium rubens (strain ATCC 28089 / DSM 1075 / NRRL 1951 / Wisconsin 54-1255) TaxID=500485 RepID=B6HL72_PENRW|nr:Pc21g07780 [Penicillium rubens Wisconsin 54-1255]